MAITLECAAVAGAVGSAGGGLAAAQASGGHHGGAVVAASGDGLYVSNVDGTGLRRLTYDGSDDDPVWSPDAEWVAFDRLLPNLSYGVMVVRRDGSGLRRLATGSEPTWSPDGRRVAFDDNSGSNDFSYVIGADGTSARRLGEGYSAYWSPDGGRVALAASADGVTLLFTAADGSSEVQVAGGESTGWSWAPDSRRFAYGVKDDPHVYVADSVTGQRTAVVTMPGSVQDVDWSPDGKTIVVEYGSGAGDDRIDLVTLSGAARTPLGQGSTPYWSEDGSRLAFTRPRQGESAPTQIVTVDASGSDEHLVASARSDECFRPFPWLQWTDATALLFLHPRASTDSCDIWHGTVGGAAVATTHAYPTGADFRWPDWTQADVDPNPVETYPTVTLSPTRQLDLKQPVGDLVASEGAAAFTSAADEGPLSVWARSGAVTKLRGSTVDTERDELAYAGGVAAWVEDNGAAPATYSLIIDGDRGATSVQALYEGDNVDLGNLYGDGDLLLYNTWGWRRNAGRLTRTNGALWRIDNSKRKLVVRGPDALDLVDVDSDRIAVLRPDGTLALLDARGRRLDSFRIGAAGVNAVRLTDSDAVVQRATAIEVWNLRSHRRVRRYPISEALGAATLQTAGHGYAIYGEGIALHLLRLSDGENQVINLPDEEGPANAVFAGNGFYYAYNTAGTRLGHVRYARP